MIDNNKGKLYSRVIAGTKKGMKINFTPGEVRPMTSKVKEALFSIIYDCNGLNMLDLFCGSGGISIEAYSRGIESSDMVEGDRAKQKVIEANLTKAGFEKARLYISDVFMYCRACKKKYDFIMVDPPFKWANKEKLLKLISKNGLLEDNGFLVIHLPKKEELSEEIENLAKYDTRTYGLNMLMFYKNK